MRLEIYGLPAIEAIWFLQYRECALAVAITPDGLLMFAGITGWENITITTEFPAMRCEPPYVGQNGESIIRFRTLCGDIIRRIETSTEIYWDVAVDKSEAKND